MLSFTVFFFFVHFFPWSVLAYYLLWFDLGLLLKNHLVAGEKLHGPCIDCRGWEGILVVMYHSDFQMRKPMLTSWPEVQLPIVFIINKGSYHLPCPFCPHWNHVPVSLGLTPSLYLPVKLRQTCSGVHLHKGVCWWEVLMCVGKNDSRHLEGRLYLPAFCLRSFSKVKLLHLPHLGTVDLCNYTLETVASIPLVCITECCLSLHPQRPLSYTLCKDKNRDTHVCILGCSLFRLFIAPNELCPSRT